MRGVFDRNLEVIAEIGINHNGNMNLAHELIRQAAICGADVVKFQAYSVDALFGPGGEDDNPEIYAGVKPLEFDYDQFVQLKKWTDEEGIEFMCSVFDIERLGWMEKIGVKRHKIASRVSKLNHDLAQKIVDTGKECFVSRGMGGQGFNGKHHGQLRQLYCVSEYPTEFTSLKMPERFKGMLSPFSSGYAPWGFSDHTLGIESALVAVGRGALAIEKHFTLDKSAEGFDHICSVTPPELETLCKLGKQMAKVIQLGERKI